MKTMVRKTKKKAVDCKPISSEKEPPVERIEKNGGMLPFTDKADPEIIRQEFAMSKNAFKRAVGHLLKEGRVRITGKTIEKV